MAPAVRDGDVVTIAPVDPLQVTVGDVILCDTWRGPLAHRVVAVDRRAQPPQFVLRGDRSQQDDRPVATGQVRGRLVAVERDGHVDRTAFAAGAWTRRLARARGRCQEALARAGRAPARPLPCCAPP